MTIQLTPMPTPFSVGLNTDDASQGWRELDIVGTDHYQANIAAIFKANPYTDSGIVSYVLLHLIAEPNNPHDANAVRVDCWGVTVGHLGRDQARVTHWKLRQGQGWIGVPGKLFYGAERNVYRVYGQIQKGKP